MARMHGKDCRVYFGSRDASGDIGAVNFGVSVDVHDTTNFADAGWRSSDPGQGAYELTLDGWYDPAVAGFGRQLESLLGASGGVLTVVGGSADAIGDDAFVFPDSMLTKRSQPVNVADLVKLTGSLVPGNPASGGNRPGLLGVLLRVLAQTTLNGSAQNGTGHDGTASSANGGRANLHVTAIDAATSAVVKVQHSTDNVTYADLITFTAATAITSESLEVSGTVNRYVRVTVTGTNTKNITFLVAFARYQGTTYA
jgi:hypothetical protein